MSVFFSIGNGPKNEPPQKDGGRIVGIVALLILSIATAGAFIVSLTSFPFTDGWYETLVFLEKHGFQPYKTLEFVLPPITLVNFRIIDWLTHSNFAADRFLGVFITLLDTALLFVWMRRFTTAAAAAFSAALLFVLITAEPLYIPGDYHDLVQLFLTLAMIVLVRPVLYDDTKLSARSAAEVFAAGVIVQLLLLAKQNVGLGMFVGYLMVLGCMTLVAVNHRDKALALKAAAHAGVFVLSFVLTGALFLKLSLPELPAWGLYKSFFLVGSKGSPLYAGSRLLHDTNNFITIWPAFLIAMAVVLSLFAQKYLAQRFGQEDMRGASFEAPAFKRNARIAASFALAMLPIVITCFLCSSIVAVDNIWLWNFWPCILVFTCYFLDIFSLAAGMFQVGAQSASHRATLFDLARILLFGMVMLAHSMTAALNIVGLAIFFGYYTAVLVDRALVWSGKIDASWQRYASVAVLMLSLLFVVKLELAKFDAPYAWWGMQEPPIYASSAKVDLPYLSGLRLSEDRAHILTSVVSTVQRETSPSDPILVYPDTPMFYMLTNRLPETKTYVQWFDFATEPSLVQDFTHVSQSPPKVVVEMSVPSDVYSGHESLLGRTVPQRPFTDYLQCMIDNGAFQELNRFFYNRSSALDGKYSLRTMRAISAEEVDQLAALALPYRAASYVVTGAMGLDGSVVTLPDMQKFADQKSSGFGGIVIAGNSDELPRFLRYLKQKTHIVLSPRDDNFILRVLKRTDEWKTLGSGCSSSLRQSLQLLKSIQVGESTSESGL